MDLNTLFNLDGSRTVQNQPKLDWNSFLNNLFNLDGTRPKTYAPWIDPSKAQELPKWQTAPHSSVLQLLSVVGQIGMEISIILVGVGLLCIMFHWKKPLRWGIIGFGASVVLTVIGGAL